MSDSYLDAVEMRAVEAASDRPLPTDDALAALELHGAVCELGGGTGVWSALLRRRGLVHCVCYDDSAPQAHALTHVLPGGAKMAAHHADRVLLLVRGHKALDESAALTAFMDAGGDMVAHVGSLDGQCADANDVRFATMLAQAFERHVTVVLPSGNDRLTFWKRRATAPPPSAASSGGEPPPPVSACGVLDVRLELVDMEAPEWANPPKPQEGPFRPEIGGRSVQPTMSREEMRQQFEASLPEGF